MQTGYSFDDDLFKIDDVFYGFVTSWTGQEGKEEVRSPAKLEQRDAAITHIFTPSFV